MSVDSRTGLRAAAIGALIGGVIVLVALFGSSRGGAGTYEITAVFDSANGLVRTGEVRVANQRVGEITNISVELGGYPTVTMAIDEEYVLRVGATADIRLASQAGQLNRYIALTNGDGEALSDGSTLGIAKTSAPVELDDLLSALTPRTRGEVRRILTGTTAALDGQGPNIERTLRHSGAALAETADLFDDIGYDRAALASIVDRAEDAASEVAVHREELEATVDQLADVLDVVANRRAELAATLNLLPGTLRVQRAALARFREAIPTIETVADEATEAVGPVSELAEELSKTVPLALPFFRSGRKLVRVWIGTGDGIRMLFEALTPLLIDLDPVLDQLNPLLETYRVRTPEMFGWMTLLGDAAANYDPVGHGVRVVGSLSEPEKQLITSSDCTPGWLPRPFDRVPGALECEPWADYADSFIGGAHTPEYFLTPEETAVRDQGLEP